MEIRRLLAGTGIQIAGRIFTAASTLFLFSWMSRTMEMGGFGQLAFYLSAFSLIDALADFGIGQMTLRKISVDADRSRYWLEKAFRERLLLSLTGALSIAGIALIYGDPVAFLLPLAALHFVTVLLGLFGAVFQREIRYLPLVLSRALGMAVTLAFCSTLLFLDVFRWEWHLAGFLLGLSFSHVLVFLLSRKRWRMLPALGGSGSVLRASWPLGLALIAQQTYFHGGHFFARSLLGEESLSLYAGPFRIFTLSLMVPQYLCATALPLLAKKAETDPLAYRKLRTRILNLLLSLGIPALLVAHFFSDRIMNLVFGADYVRGGPVLAMLGFAGLGVVFGSVATTCLVAREQTRSILAVSGLAALASLPAFYGFTETWGIVGTAAANAAMEGIVAMLSWYVLIRTEWKTTSPSASTSVPH